MSYLYKKFNNIVLNCLSNGIERFAIVPFGENGMLLKQILQERYNISDIILIDNYLYQYNNNVRQFADLDNSDIAKRHFIVTSALEEIMDCVKKFVPDEQIHIPHFISLDDNKFSYGPLSESCHEIDTIGRFCSTAEGSCVVPNHPLRSVSTHEFMYSSYHFPQIKIEYERLKWEEFNPKKTKIGNDVWIGRNVIILNGASIGNGAVIGAGSVVTKDIPDYAVAVGNPVRVIKYRFTQEQIEKLNDIKWWDWSLEEIEACYEDFKDINIFLQKHYKKDESQ